MSMLPPATIFDGKACQKPYRSLAGGLGPPSKLHYYIIGKRWEFSLSFPPYLLDQELDFEPGARGRLDPPLTSCCLQLQGLRETFS